jgi:uncharacterized OB-fold protein
MNGEPIKVVLMPVRLEYTVTAGARHTRYLRALEKKHIVGGRCSKCTRVYVPPRGSCPTCGIPTLDEVEVADKGTITTFCIVSIPFANMPFAPPYVLASVLLDGANNPTQHLVRGIAADQVRMGQRVRAVWVKDEELAPTSESIKWFEPSDEPDASYETYKEHL